MIRIGAKEVCELTGMARRTLQLKTKAGDFPRPSYDGIRAVWDRKDIDGWLEKGKDKLAATPPASAPEPGLGHSWSEKGDGATIVTGSVERIRTLEDAIRHAGVDTAVWYVLDWECTSWEVGMKLQARNEKGRVTSETPHVQPLWRLSMRLRRILPKPFLEASAALFEKMGKHAPAYPPPKVRPTPTRRILLEMDLPDVHFGKLAWRQETGSDYDLKIAETVYQNAVEDLLDVSSGFIPELIVFTVGSDYYHIDNARSTTTGGTFVDSDGRYAKIIEVGEYAFIRGVDTALRRAPVKIKWIPGNHDRIASYHLARTLAAWYRNSPHVEVDFSPASRKYLRWGTNLIGYAHGDLAKLGKLPLIMATERPKDWAETTFREWRTGHLHHSKKLDTVSVDSFNGVSVRVLQSLSGTDSWHYDMGYVGTAAAAECYIMDHDAGYVGHFNVKARTQ